MLKKINPTTTNAWAKLNSHYNEVREKHLKDWFSEDINRAANFTLQFEELYLDYSKNRISKGTVDLLIELANEVDVKSGIEAMFSGEKINETEERAVLHTALRNQKNESIEVDGENVIPKIEAVKKRMKAFSYLVESGDWLGYTGKPIKHIVNIGIGGSDLGPVMVTEALKPFWKPGIEVFFVSNVDASHIVETLKKIDTEQTLFIIASKSFTTQETMANAHTARKWFINKGGKEEDIKKHFIALSTNVEGANKFGIASENVFEFWDWVGGRYSLSSAIGMSICLTIGFDDFVALQRGLSAMDEHFNSSPLEKNIPVILALIGIWYNNFFKAETEAILPYDQYLHRFAAYFQQANMESNGKSVDRNGDKIEYQTGPIIWGEPGTNGQHAFYQLIHQGSKLIPCDFIAAANSHHQIGEHHQMLLSNFFAQTEALMKGKTAVEVIADYSAEGISLQQAQSKIPFRVFDGNRPTNSILIKKLTPYNLGLLIAMYEHKIYTQGLIWNIFSFDQWGVELGKQLANKILPELKNDATINSHDSSTNALINQYKLMRDEKLS